MPPAIRRKCLGRCGNWLTTPESIALGYGRVCAERLGITGPPTLPARASPATTPAPHVEGQTELPITDHQPTLWSL